MQLFELCRVLDKNYRQKANARNSAGGADLGVRFFRRLRQVHCFAGSIAALSVYNWTTFARAQPLRSKHDKKLGRTNMAPRHFLKLADFTKDELNTMLRRAAEIKALQKAGTPYAPFGGKVLLMIFEKASTRTRVSFESGFYQLGGNVIHLSSQGSFGIHRRYGSRREPHVRSCHDPHLRSGSFAGLCRQ